MVRVAIKGVLANKVRLGLTALAVVLGVSLVAGTFVFTDTINRQFTSIFADTFQGIDVTVRAASSDFGAVSEPFSADVIDDVRAVDGVAAAVGGVNSQTTQVLDAEGEPIGRGVNTLGFSWATESSLSPLRIKEGNGRAPTGAGEVAIDVNTAELGMFAVGDVITVVNFNGPEQFELVGLVSFGESDSLLGATLTTFELSEAQRLFGYGNEFTTINIKAVSGVSSDELQPRVAAVLPAGLEAVTGQTQQNEQVAQIEEDLSIVNVFLLVFAFVSIFVGAFIISNTFRIIVTQRTRELALLRAVGATGRQVRTLMVLEALITAVIASALGIVAGLGMAIAIRGLFSVFTSGMPPAEFTLAPRTVVIGFLVGIVLTLVAVYLPARRASRVPPVAAMREELATPKRRSLTRRAVIGTVVTVLSAVLLLFGLFANPSNAIAYVGAGAAVMFIGVSILAPLAAGPIADFIGGPLVRLFGVSGQLARDNTKRRPRRTARTASALMIGIALVVFFAILGDSLKASINEIVEGSFTADITVQSVELADEFPPPFSPAFGEEMRQLDSVGTVSAMRFEFVEVDGTVEGVGAIEPGSIDEVLKLEPVGDALRQVASLNTVIVAQDVFDERAYEIGSTISLQYPNNTVVETRIVGTFENTDVRTIIPVDLYVASETLEANVRGLGDNALLALTADGVSLETAKADVDALAATYGNVEALTKSEVVADLEAGIDLIIRLFGGLLVFAVIIALLGIVNTLALSVFERTREIGLLRAVGMDRRQLRRMVRWEAVIIAVFGAILGIGLGTFFGWAVVQAQAEEGLAVFSFPTSLIIGSLILAAIAGVVAAVWPAGRAAKLNVLEAIAYE